MSMPTIEPFVEPRNVDLGIYDQVLAFGDSLMQQLVQNNESRKNIVFPENVWAPLNTITANKHIIRGPEDDRRSSDSFVQQIKTLVHRAQEKSQNVALIVGSSVWDILEGDENTYSIFQGTHFQDHIAACRLLIDFVRKEFPNVDVFWKSQTAMHIHRVAEYRKDWYHVNRINYMSTSRAYDLYRFQKEYHGGAERDGVGSLSCNVPLRGVHNPRRW